MDYPAVLDPQLTPYIWFLLASTFALVLATIFHILAAIGLKRETTEIKKIGGWIMRLQEYEGSFRIEYDDDGVPVSLVLQMKTDPKTGELNISGHRPRAVLSNSVSASD